MDLPDSADFFKCNTCKACFSSTLKVKDHYKGDWHILNSKRRANGLLPLKRDEFKLLKEHAKPKVSPKKETASLSSLKADYSTDLNNNTNPQEKEEVVEPKASPAPRLGTNISIFDDKEFETMDECVQYMCEQFGFFIPDIEYMSNLEGLLTYLGEKVKCGGFCLYCQKQLQPGWATMNHMVDKSHCKLAYTEDVDLEEYEDFYDFSASHEGEDEDVELDEDGNIIETKMEISNIGELILPSGRTVGHRDFRLYYKQYHRPEENRPSVLAQQREELLRLGYKFGASKMQPEDILELSDTDVMAQLVRYQKEIRRGQIVEQRYAMRDAQRNQTREYKSNTQKLRSAENTTAKIRDYHSRLM